MERPHARRAGDFSTVLRMAQRGWRLFPIKEREKQPLIADWPNQATNDKSRLENWTTKFRGCNWGAVPGSESGMFVLDVDGDDGLLAILNLERLGCGFQKL